jgi:hypothetical protein
LNGELSFEIDPWSFFGVGRSIEATPSMIAFLARSSPEPHGGSCNVSHFCEQDSINSLLGEIEEQPLATVERAINRDSLMQQLCALPSVQVRFCDKPSVVATHLDGILTELLYA